ncbi:MAG: glycoside hydrolase family 99-like domain-containing protein [Alsobacter sp.]
MPIVISAGLFDREWYANRIGISQDDALQHWLETGLRTDQPPNFLFDIQCYRRVAGLSEEDPVRHYVEQGDRLGLSPSPFFDAGFVRATFGHLAQAHETALALYLRLSRTGEVDPNPFFSTSFYISRYPDVLAAGKEPYEHFLHRGQIEYRDPLPTFKTAFYARKHGVPPGEVFTHYLSQGAARGLITDPSEDETVFTEFDKFSRPGPAFRALPTLEEAERLPAPLVDAFAFYLPQFHPIEVNNKAWGEGFTEWTNLARALPRFKGHYQPRVPRDLGFYDLRDPTVLAEQAALAKLGGLKGFAFYYYNFDGDRLLETPTDLFLESSVEVEFFLIWANESWSRAWDGHERDVIKKQSHDKARIPDIAADLARHMRDPRYYRLKGRPLLVIYRPAVADDAVSYFAALRKALRAELYVEPLLFMAQAFGAAHPGEFGLDGAMEFPPHKLGDGLASVAPEMQLLDSGFSGFVFRYEDYVARSRASRRPSYALIRSAMVMWDNEPRRPGRGTAVIGSSPAAYGAWLSDLVSEAREHPVLGRPVVAINAWNEWCEGAYLEPDQHFGAAYLLATRQALGGALFNRAGTSIILVGHDAHRHGAQLLLLNLARDLKRRGLRVHVLLLEGGALEADYRSVADTVRIAKGRGNILRALADPELARAPVAIANTVVSADAALTLRQAGKAVVGLVHEMAMLIAERSLQSQCRAMARAASVLVFPAAIVEEHFRSFAEPEGKVVQLSQGQYQMPLIAGEPPIRTETDEPVVIGLGYADLRKGYDLFVATANLFHERGLRVRFRWVGDVEAGLKSWIRPLGSNFEQVPFTEAVREEIRQASALLLSSREDPFPSVAIEALSMGLPVACLAGSGGIAGLVQAYPWLGAVAETPTATALAEAVSGCLRSSPQVALRRSHFCLRNFSFPVYAQRIMQLAGIAVPAVSVVIPNYNYRAYLESRISSVVAQNVAPMQVVVLDDHSTDGSREEIIRLALQHRPSIQVDLGTVNSGHPVSQWRKGLRFCFGDYVWIAEADDEADSGFLERLIEVMDRSNCSFVFCNSKQVDGAGNLLAESYDYYYDTIAPDLFGADFVSTGQDFLEKALSVRNPILNVSSVLWRRSVLEEVLAELGDDVLHAKVAADWLVYVEACRLKDAVVGYVSQSLNVHRRHQASATHVQDRQAQLDEIASVHQRILETFAGSRAAAIRREQAQYRSELREQFGLATSDDDGRPARTGGGPSARLRSKTRRA